MSSPPLEEGSPSSRATPTPGPASTTGIPGGSGANPGKTQIVNGKDYATAPGAAPVWPGYHHTHLAKMANMPRNLPVKRYDGEPLTRADVQHALLSHLFSSTERVFTNPRPGTRGIVPTPVYAGAAPSCSRRSDDPAPAPAVENAGAEVAAGEAGDEGEAGPSTRPSDLPEPGAEKLTFKELYIEALINSQKCTKSMRDKILTDEEYAEDFAKVCLLVNVGRINTTLAFYPEMKTILRSYHPIPSLQRTENTRRNMQDAPRMKSLLKAVLLDGEKQSQMGPGAGAGGHNSKAKDTANADDGLEEVPTSLEILIERFARGTRPPTSVVTLVFLLSAHANQITTAHFAYPHDMHSIFFPHGQYPLSSAQRARAFLWLLYRYLEMPTSPPGTPNPFDDEVSRESGQVARARWQEMSVDERSRVGPIWKGCRRPKSEMEQERLDADGDGKMSAAPETGSEEAKVDSGSAETDEQPAPPPASQDGGVSPHSMPAPLPEEAETNAEGGAKPASEEAAAPSAPAPIENTHRELVPELTVIPHEVAALENTDEADEIAWGKRMQHERGNFLLRFQEEEQTKAGAAASIGPGKAQDAAGSASTAAGGATAANTPSQALTPSGSGRGKKRPSAGNSSYPLANILAAASAGAQLPGTAEALKRARMSVGGSARGRGVGSPQIEEDASGWGSPWAEGEPAAPSSPPRPSLWSLDITVPPHQRGESLPRLAWRRILERAQRGVGDASYDSDASDCAEEEAIDERPRGEMARILKVIRDVRTRAGDLDVPGVEGRIESQEPQRV